MINREEYNENEKRNLRFYKLLGQNHEVIVNAILRGKDINYEVPSKGKVNEKIIDVSTIKKILSKTKK